MTTHLISILGLPRKNQSGDYSYQTATYRFQDGAERTTTTFGLALDDWYRTCAKPPMVFDRILWLGTAQSAWGSLLQTVLGDAAIEEPIYLRLFDESRATQEQADQVAASLSRVTGRRHECRLVPPCANPAEQADFVSLFSGELRTKDRVVLDLTHGLRNQSLMLAQSALMLEGAFQVRIEGLFYGGLEIPHCKGEPAPAVDLTGILVQARLAQALAAFRQSGDVRVLADHLQPDSGFRRQIENLGHAVAIHDYTQARSLATSALGELSKTEVGVLEPALRTALESLKARSLAESQFQQAEEHLKREDYFRAILKLFEGAITRVCQRKGWDITEPEDCLKKANSALRALQSEDWKTLECLRNQMAHGVATNWYSLMQKAKNPAELEKLLQGLLTTIPTLAERA